ncbi:MAG: RluA family pseudouridine synthase [Casimicrobiaceae bacterium]|nr:RluA family pseudouridine synthase [Casimicrobiaceae bacterium]MCX8098358.1 RluA family pseudouridine synthase [Casimicrobiaceae bacterium]MDW8312526.1 RluA family pseudouridine synthase [Burkholderiales bacterium]
MKDLARKPRFEPAASGSGAAPEPLGLSGTPQEALERVPARRIRVDAAYAGQRIDNFLIRELRGVPKTHIYRILRSGEVRVNGCRVRPETKLEPGDELRLPPLRLPPKSAAGLGTLQHVPLPVLYEDAHLLAIDKPAGVAVHGGSGVSVGVIEQLRAQRPRAPLLELAHRLDRETSGVLLVAKTRAALVGLHALMRQRAADKRYVVAVRGEWVNERQHVKKPLIRLTRHDGERRVEVDPEAGQFAHTIFNLLERRKTMSLLEAELRTGRTHQIRVHLAYLGFPVLGDDKYGDRALNRSLARREPVALRRMFLHAASLRLTHPVTGVDLRIDSPLPEALAAFWHASREVS